MFKKSAVFALTATILLLPAWTGHSVATLADDGSDFEPMRYDGHIVVRTLLTSRKQLDTMLAISPDVWSERITLGQMDFRIPPENVKALEQSGIKYQVIISDVQRLIDIETASQNQENLGGSWFSDYKTYSEIMDRLDFLDDVNPALTETFLVGQSLEGRDIRGIRIGGGNGNPAIIMQGCQHAREWISPASVMFFADHLINNYGSDPTVTQLVDDVEFIIIPVVNPDGYVYSHTTQRLWRKNRRNNGGGEFGVDLNRNWGVAWGGEGSSGNPGSETYRGTAAFSEPETAAMRDFITANQHAKVHLDIHSFGQLLLAPWGYTEDLPPDYDLFQQLGADMQSAILGVHGRFYEHGSGSSTLYLAAGISPDWTYGTFGMLGFTFELRDTGQNGFILPADQIIPNGEELIPPVFVLAEHISRLFDFSLSSELPTYVTPNTPTPVQVTIEAANDNTLDPSSVSLFARVGTTGNFTEISMSDVGNDTFEALLPATPCNTVVQYYFEASTTDGDTATLPANAPVNVFSALAIVQEEVWTDDFNSDLGWSVTNGPDLADGGWERGVPAGGGDRFDPADDFDGSGACYLTDNEDGNSDVDGGPTILTSPLIDLSDGTAGISYARWFSNDDDDGDRLIVEISNNNGSSWTEVEQVGNISGWQMHTFDVADFVTPTAQVRVRFIVSDNPNDSITEAAIDAFAVNRLTCGSEITLTDFDVVFGSLQSGSLDDLLASDDSYLRTRSSFGFLSSEPNLMRIDFDFDAPSSPGEIDIIIESRLNNPGGSATVQLRNAQNALEIVGQYDIGTAEVTETIADVPAATYINNGAIEMQVKHVVIATFSLSGFQSSFDLVTIE